MSKREREPIAAAYERARQRWKGGDLDGALAAAREVIALDPAYPNAQNFAGWLLLQRPSPSETEREAAIAHLREAHHQAPHDAVPRANLCDALVGAGREAEAVALLEAELAAGVLAAEARNWLGWRALARGDGEAALAHLGEATRLRPTWGVPWLNLAALFERAGAEAHAYVAYEVSLTCSEPADKQLARRRTRELAAALEARGEEVPIVLLREDGTLLGPELVALERAARRGAWDEVADGLAALGQASAANLVDAIGIAERAGEAAQAAGHLEAAGRLLSLALRGYEIYASWSTSGGEGTARMADVLRLRARLASWSR